MSDERILACERCEGYDLLLASANHDVARLREQVRQLQQENERLKGFLRSVMRRSGRRATPRS